MHFKLKCSKLHLVKGSFVESMTGKVSDGIQKVSRKHSAQNQTYFTKSVYEQSYIKKKRLDRIRMPFILLKYTYAFVGTGKHIIKKNISIVGQVVQWSRALALHMVNPHLISNTKIGAWSQPGISPERSWVWPPTKPSQTTKLNQIKSKPLIRLQFKFR